MAPFTPFFCEMMYQNLRRALPPGAPESVHWCDFPEAEAAQVRPSSCIPLQAVCGCLAGCMLADESVCAPDFLCTLVLTRAKRLRMLGSVAW